ncbi:hydrolase inhibitor motif protein [Ranid herpesvirus 3]|uniref:Hydrolase inhibitor motif protein n=1 Tax=Ranid herpesvirus 3 TaxID=1987509 RepID=A0A1X9T598_9VIRU|nr:hydrolase inhibitor motif protein [Ranid herpesvirus 3]ARR28825.1 hydrolase inhibitor motif protein [Ranid herpesvirus 3]
MVVNLLIIAFMSSKLGSGDPSPVGIKRYKDSSMIVGGHRTLHAQLIAGPYVEALILGSYIRPWLHTLPPSPRECIGKSNGHCIIYWYLRLQVKILARRLAI